MNTLTARRRSEDFMLNTQFGSERIVILGGTSGIGLATAERAAADGATVIRRVQQPGGRARSDSRQRRCARRRTQRPLAGNERGDRSAMYDSLSEALPVGRVGGVSDIAETFLYLMRNGYSSGTIVTVDGGSVLV
jgi:NAD(P)-dependent dehydrogenase (short-subunit alcohol dehydrogenase family)